MEGLSSLQEAIVREFEKIKKKEEKEEKEIDKVRSHYNKERNKVDQKYTKQAAGLVARELVVDYNILQERSSIEEFDEEILNRAREIKEGLDKLSDEESKHIAISLLRLSDEESRALEQLKQKSGFESRVITSYIAEGRKEDGTNICYLLIPINGKDNKKLGSNLENKIDGVMEQKTVSRGYAITSETRNGAIGAKNDEIKFGIDMNYIENKEGSEFILWEMITENGDEAKELAKSMARKLSNSHIQPEGFQGAQLEHRVERISPNLMEYILKSDIGDLLKKAPTPKEDKLHRIPRKITDKYISKMTGLTLQGVRRLATMGTFERDADGNVTLGSLNTYRVEHGKQPIELPIYRQKPQSTRAQPTKEKVYDFTNPEEMKTRAYQTLEQIEAKKVDESNSLYITPNQLAEVLGLSRGFITRYKRYLPYIKSKRNIYFNIEEVKNFIDTHTPKAGGWKKTR